MTVEILARFRERRINPMAGILIRTRIGMEVYGTIPTSNKSCSANSSRAMS